MFRDVFLFKLRYCFRQPSTLHLLRYSLRAGLHFPGRGGDVFWAEQLLKYDGTIPYTYSDMNGYGHFVAPLLWVNLSYIAAALLLAVLTSLLWVRGGRNARR